jgi:drug/metabolite transporter (DMT)-like permease
MVEEGFKKRQKNNTYGIILFNFAIFTSGLGMLIAKVLYTRHPALTASQILTVRAILSTIVAAGLTNKDLKSALWTGIPEGCGVKLAKRSLQASLCVWLQFSLTR